MKRLMPWSKAVGGAEAGGAAGGQHHAGGAAADHVAAHEAHVGQRERSRVRRRGVRELLHRQRLAGERCLVDEQVLGLEQAQVGRNHVAGGQLDHVAGDHARQRNLHLRGTGRLRVEAVVGAGRCGSGQRHGTGCVRAQHRRGGVHHRAQLFGRLAGAHLLHERQQHRQQHHDADHDRAARLAREVGEDGQPEKQQRQRREDELGQPPQRGDRDVGDDLVGADALAPCPRLRLGQAGGR